ncbi:MAG: Multiple RNA-binding domain-containing protein 1 [Chaenotheca gracillima]|nr:MAG: Multiple RNA-binding domain-containing protein 1 [Chaenotheca gracillima]
MESSRPFNILPSKFSSRPQTPQVSSASRDRRALQSTTGNLQTNGLQSFHGDAVKSEVSTPAASVDSPPSLLSHGSYNDTAKSWIKSDRDLDCLEKDVAQYRQYRAKQRRDNGRDGDGVWHDRVERAFQKGLAKYPPLGRTKVPWRNGKSYGRNELIAAYIVRKTGEWRSRKQVSSHIQVLKAKMKNDTAWMALVTPTSEQNSEALKRFAAGVSNASANARNTRTETVCAAQNIVRPVNFDMWVEPPRAPHEESSIDRNVHIYTTLSTATPLQAVKLDTVENWRVTFPRLSSLHHDGAVDCEITLLETSINMNTTSPLAGCELGTRFEVLASSAFANHTWHSITNVYSPGNTVQNRYDPVPHADGGPNSSVKLRPRFASSFWAHKFVELGVKQSFWKDRTDERLAEAKARSYVRGISAMQELYATPSGQIGDASAKRVAIFLWKFTKTRPEDTGGQTQWRKLIPPPSKILSNSAGPPPVAAIVPPVSNPPLIPIDWSNLDVENHQDVTSLSQPTMSFYDTDFQQPTPVAVSDSLEQSTRHGQQSTVPAQSFYSPYPTDVSQGNLNPFIADDFASPLYPEDPSVSIVDGYQHDGGSRPPATVSISMPEPSQSYYDDHWQNYGLILGSSGHQPSANGGRGELHSVSRNGSSRHQHQHHVQHENHHHRSHQMGAHHQPFLGEDGRFVMVDRDLQHSFP